MSRTSKQFNSGPASEGTLVPAALGLLAREQKATFFAINMPSLDPEGFTPTQPKYPGQLGSLGRPRRRHSLASIKLAIRHGPRLTLGNTRADILTMAQAAMLVMPGTLVIPTDEKGKARLKLDMVAPANGFKSHNAHDALGDVEATIHIARLLKARVPSLWQAMMNVSRKPSVISFTGSHPVFLLGEASGAVGSLKPVTLIVRRPDYDAALAVFDLRTDPEPLLALDEAELLKVLTKRNSPIRSVRANAQPIVLPLALAPSAAAAMRRSEEMPAERAARFHQTGARCR